MEPVQGINSSPSAAPCRSTARGRIFPTTRWSDVLNAVHGDVTRSGQALETLCRTYWNPLYVYARRRGYSESDAEDLTQDFFAWLLQREWLEGANRERGRFRSFLRVTFDRFLANEWDKSQRLKRGGGRVISLQLHEESTGARFETADPRTPEQSYEWSWALTLLEHVLNRVGADYAHQGKADVFEQLKPCLLGDRTEQRYAALADKLQMTEGSVKVAVFRLRQKYRQTLRDEIAHTVSQQEEVEDEIVHLFSVLAKR